MQKKHIIIGASAAGIGAALALRRLDSNCSIIIISQEKEKPYNKCLLADYAHGEKQEDQIGILRSDSAREKNIELCLSTMVIAIEREEKKIICSDGRHFLYDFLFLGMGARPLLPLIDGISTHANVFTFYSLSDVDAILNAIRSKNLRTAIVIGAGLSGLECADALNAQGLSVSIVERSEHVLHSQIDKEGANHIQRALQKAGVKLYVDKSVMRIDSHAVYLSDTTYIQADLIICTVGVVPNSELAQKAKLMVEDNAVWVDDTMQTSDTSVFAGGDCVLVTHQISKERLRNCSWPEAMQQGMIAAHNMVGIKKTYAGVCPITSSAFFNIKFATCGIVSGYSVTYTTYQQNAENQYIKVTVDQENRVCGFVLVGDTKHLSLLRRLILTRESFQAYKTTMFNV